MSPIDRQQTSLSIPQTLLILDSEFFFFLTNTGYVWEFKYSLFDGSLLEINKQWMRAVWAALKESAKGHRRNVDTLTKR